MVFLWFQQERAGRKFAEFLVNNHLVFKAFMMKCLQTLCVWYDFDLDARVCTSWYLLQGIIGHRGFKIIQCGRMVLF